MITCKIEKVSECLNQDAGSGYVAVRVSATIMDRPRNSKGSGPGYGIWRSEDPVLITRKSNNVKQQTIAIIDDLAKREKELNQAGAQGMRLLPNQVAVLRSWSGGISIDGYVALFERTPGAHFDYKVIDVVERSVAQHLKALLSEGYRSVAFVAPEIIVMERGPDSAGKVDEYQVLQGYDTEHLGPELAKAAASGFRVMTAGVSRSGLLTTVLLEHIGDQKQIFEYQVLSAYSQRELESKLNDLANQGYSPVPAGILPINSNKFGDRGMVAAPQRVQLIAVKAVGPKYSAFRVIEAFRKQSESEIGSALQNNYDFVDFVGTANSSFIIMGQIKEATAAQ